MSWQRHCLNASRLLQRPRTSACLIVLYLAMMATLVLTNLLAHARGGMIARGYAGQIERAWGNPGAMLASVQALPR